MNDAFRITIHWAERIIEIRWPEAPSLAAIGRFEEEVHSAVSRLGEGWSCLVDDSELKLVSEEVARRAAEVIAWSRTRGHRMSARVAGRGDAAHLMIVKAAPPGTTFAAPFSTRSEAWAALVERAAEAKRPGEQAWVGLLAAVVAGIASVFASPYVDLVNVVTVVA